MLVGYDWWISNGFVCFESMSKDECRKIIAMLRGGEGGGPPGLGTKKYRLNNNLKLGIKKKGCSYSSSFRKVKCSILL